MFCLKLVNPALVEDGDHLHDIGDVDRPDGQVEPWPGEKNTHQKLKKVYF